MQHAWNAAYEALATSHPHGTTALRRPLLLLSVRLTWHAYWKSVPRCPRRVPSRGSWPAPGEPHGLDEERPVQLAVSPYGP